MRDPLQVAVGGILLMAAGGMLTHAIAERMPTSERTAVQVYEQKRCNAVVRFIDRRDSAYFEIGCAKPLPDTILFLPRRVP